MKQATKNVAKRLTTIFVDILMVGEDLVELILKGMGAIRRFYVMGIAAIVSRIEPDRYDLKYFDKRIDDMVEDDTQDVRKLGKLRDNVKETLRKKTK